MIDELLISCFGMKLLINFMIDPAGRFFQNVENEYQYSSPILLKGVLSTYNEMGYDQALFLKRGGVYEWS